MKGHFPVTDKNDLIIAADAGYLHLEKLGIMPDIILGDFDSMQAPEGVDVIRHPVMKDDTDTMLAVKLGFEKGYQNFVIYGGLGGERTDHTIANIQTLAYISENSGSGTLIGDGESFTVIKDSDFVIESENKTFSVFAYGGNASGVSIVGAVYEVQNAEITPFFPLGVSNKVRNKSARISVKKGSLLIVY